MPRFVKHSDAEVETWAKHYTLSQDSLETMEKKINISHSTLWWCFTHRLPNINPRLFALVNAKLFRNRK